MDRLFLAGLVREIDASVRGARVRTLRLGPKIGSGTRSLTLRLSKPGAPDELVFHLGPGVAGIFTRDGDGKPARALPRETKLEKLIASSTLTSVDGSALDRVVTVTVEQTRLSGKTRRIAMVLELVAARASLFIVDVDSSTIVDLLSTGTARLATGESYRELDPPPRASLPAVDAVELGRRLENAEGAPEERHELDPDTLLSATGWTPLLVKEMRFLIETQGHTRNEAFTELNRRLQAPRPVLYVDPARPAKVVLSPITLASASPLVPHPRASFNDAMAEALELTLDAERSTALRQRLGSALSRRHKRLRSLQRKLEKQRDQLPPPATLRQTGETLLAGLARAKRIDDTHVRVPDPFDPDGRLIDIEIDPRLGLPDNAERLFRRSRKAERTEIELGRRLEEMHQQLAFAEGARVSLDDANRLDELEAIRDELDEQGFLAALPSQRGAQKSKAGSRPRAGTKRLPPRRFQTARGNVILVGRSARSNAELTFRLAKPDDLWLHASGIPGSHVVLKRSGSNEPGPHDVDVDVDVITAAGYAAYFSKGRNDTYVDVMVTPRKNVTAIKGAPPGLVRVVNVETVRVRPTPPPVSESPREVG